MRDSAGRIRTLEKRVRSVWSIGFAVVVFLASVPAASAQTAEQAWLKYRAREKPLSVLTRVTALGESPLERTAAMELERGLRTLSANSGHEASPNVIVLGTTQEMRWRKRKSSVLQLEPDEFLISWSQMQL